MANITGTEGDDTDLQGTNDADTIDGGAGADVMTGGFGDDTYFVDNSGDTVVEAADGGYDTVVSSVSYSLAPDVENLYLVGDEDLVGIGNELGNQLFGNNGNNLLFGNEADDYLSGNAGNDTLDSDGGNDLLDGGAGDDSLVGGSGDDTYMFGADYGTDTIVDEGGDSDRVVLQGLALSDVSLVREGDDVVVVVNGTGERLVLTNWFVDASRVESIEFAADETLLDAETIERIVNNVAPVATDDSATIVEDAASPVTGNVLANDSDANATDFVEVTNPGTYQGLYGTLELAADGSYTYTLDSSLAAVQGLAQGETLTESFTYEVSDDVPLYTGTASAQLSIVIQGADEASSGRHIFGTNHKDRLLGTDGDDLLQGGRGKDWLNGGSGVDILQGGRGKDKLVDRDGSTVFDGGRGKDELTGGASADFFAGGRGKDELELGGGSDVIAFNKGDGVDHIEGECQNGVLSLGGGIRYEDLRFRKDGKDLILETGGSDRLVFEDWYKGKQSVVTLQVVAEAMQGFSQSSSNQLLNDRVELFDFRQLVDAFDDARSSKKNMDSWKLMNELLDAHLGGSDDSALGGDLAYRYGMTGTLEGMSWDAARDTVAAPGFGTDMQTIQPLAAAQDDAVKLV